MLILTLAPVRLLGTRIEGNVLGPGLGWTRRGAGQATTDGRKSMLGGVSGLGDQLIDAVAIDGKGTMAGMAMSSPATVVTSAE